MIGWFYGILKNPVIAGFLAIDKEIRGAFGPKKGTFPISVANKEGVVKRGVSGVWLMTLWHSMLNSGKKVKKDIVGSC